MRMRYKMVLAGGFVGAVAMAAAAFAQTPAPSPDSTEAPAAKDGRARMHHMLVHSESKIQTDDGFVTRIVDTGEVTAVNGNSVTIKRADDETVTVTAGPGTKIRRNGEQAAVGDIKAGDRAHIVQIVDGGATTVAAIRAASPDFVPERKMGKHRREHGPMGRPGRMPADSPGVMPADMPAEMPADEAVFAA